MPRTSTRSPDRAYYLRAGVGIAALGSAMVVLGWPTDGSSPGWTFWVGSLVAAVGVVHLLVWTIATAVVVAMNESSGGPGGLR